MVEIDQVLGHAIVALRRGRLRPGACDLGLATWGLRPGACDLVRGLETWSIASRCFWAMRCWKRFFFSPVLFTARHRGSLLTRGTSSAHVILCDVHLLSSSSLNAATASSLLSNLGAGPGSTGALEPAPPLSLPASPSAPPSASASGPVSPLTPAIAFPAAESTASLLSAFASAASPTAPAAPAPPC